MKNYHLAKKVKEIRTQKGMSQEELASLAKLSLRTVQRIENCETGARGYTLQRLAGVLDIPAGQLIMANGSASKKWWLLFHLSALSFMLFPLLGPLVPFVLWRTNLHKMQGMESDARSLINFQVAWCLLLAFVYAIMLVCKINHFPVFPYPFYAILGVYILNPLYVIFRALYIFSD